MFGLSDLLSLIMSAFIILPIVIFMREAGYLLVGWIFGLKNPRLTIGSGPRLFKYGILDVRKHYHLYSWFSYDRLKKESKWVYVMIYAGPILINAIVGLTINALIANGIIVKYETFWNRFIFYQFYYVLFDSVPMMTVNGMPNNGMLIYEMLRYGKRTDYSNEPFIPSTSQVEEEYEELMEEIEEIKEEEEHQEQQLRDARSQSDPAGKEATEEEKAEAASRARKAHEEPEDPKDRQERKTGGLED